MKKEKKKSSYIFNLIIIPILIFNFFILFNNYKNGYFIGKIESINKSEDTITIEVSPIKSTSSFARKVKSNHKIEFKDSISISGLTSRGKKNLLRKNYMKNLIA